MDKNVYQKLQSVRVAVGSRNLKKSGKNKFAGFDYYELKDFLQIANEEFDKVGLCPVFTFDYKPVKDQIIQIARLTIYEGTNSSITFETPVADATTKGQLPIQSLGSQHTYLKRYLYLNALELAEFDSVDCLSQEDKTPSSEPKKAESRKGKATPKQIDLIKSYYPVERIAKMLMHYQIEKIEDLSVMQASDAIAQMAREKGEKQ